MASPTFPFDVHGASGQGSVPSGSGTQAYGGQYQSTSPTYGAQEYQTSTPQGTAYTAQYQPASTYNAQQQQQSPQQQYDYTSPQPQPQQQQQQQASSSRPTLVHSEQSPAWVLQPAMWIHKPPNWVVQPAIWVPPVIMGASGSTAASHVANTPASDTVKVATLSAIEADPQPAETPQPQPQAAQLKDESPLPDFGFAASDIDPSLDKMPDDVLFQVRKRGTVILLRCVC